MAVCAIANVTSEFAWHEMPLAEGHQYHAMWWEQYNAQRQLSAFGKVPEIHLSRNGSSREDSLIV